MENIFKKLFFGCLLLLILIFLSFYFLTVSIETYVVIFIVSSLLYLITILALNYVRVNKKQLFLILLIFFTLKFLFVPIEPIGSDDYYRYLWDGKVQASGINPYLYAPIDYTLNSLHTELLPKKVSYPQLKTIYFPFSQLLFTLAYWISGESATGLKIILFIAELVIQISLYHLLLRFSMNLKYILVYSLLPLVVFQFFIDAHIDLVGAALMLASITTYFYKRKFFSYILLGLSISIKPTGILLIPFIFQNEQMLKEKLKSILIPVIIFIITFLPYAFTATPLDTFIHYSVNWTFNGMVYNVLSMFFSSNLTIRALCGIFYFTIIIFLFLSKVPFIKKIFLSLFLLLILSPVVHPWYLIWFVVFLPIVRSYSGIYFVGAISLASITVLTYQLTGAWQESTFIILGQYIPLVLIFFYETFVGKFWGKAIA